MARREERGFRFWVLTRWADVTAVLRHPRASVDRPFQPRPAPLPPGTDPEALHPVGRALRALSRIMLFRDPPEHTRLIAELLGVPVEDYQTLKRWSDDLALMLDGSNATQVVPRAASSAAEFVAYLREVVRRRRAAPGEDLLSGMLATSVSGRTWLARRDRPFLGPGAAPGGILSAGKAGPGSCAPHLPLIRGSARAPSSLSRGDPREEGRQPCRS